MFIQLLKKELSSTIITFCHTMTSIIFSSSIIKIFHLLRSPFLFKQSCNILSRELRRTSSIRLFFMFSDLLILEFFYTFRIVNSETGSSESLSTNTTLITVNLQTRALGILELFDITSFYFSW